MDRYNCFFASFSTESTRESISSLMVNVWVILFCSVIVLILAILFIRKMFDRYLNQKLKSFDVVPEPYRFDSEDEPIMMPQAESRDHTMKNHKIHSRYPDPGDFKFYVSIIVLVAILGYLISSIKELKDSVVSLQQSVSSLQFTLYNEADSLRWDIRHLYDDYDNPDSDNPDSDRQGSEKKPTDPVLDYATFSLRPEEYSAESVSFPASLELAFDLLKGICPDKVFCTVSENDQLVTFYRMTLVGQDSEKCVFVTPFEITEELSSCQLSIVAWNGSESYSFPLNRSDVFMQCKRVFGESVFRISSDNETRQTLFSFTWNNQLIEAENVTAVTLLIRKGEINVGSLDLTDSVSGKTEFNALSLPFIPEEELSEVTAELSLTYQSGIVLSSNLIQYYYKTSFYTKEIPLSTRPEFRLTDANGRTITFKIN